MVSSKSSACPYAHAAVNASSPSAPRTAPTVRSCSARLAGGRGQPIPSRTYRAALPVPYPLARTLLAARSSRHGRMVW
jgi:hypothetical protein